VRWRTTLAAGLLVGLVSASRLATAAAAETLALDGEVIARTTSAISPPAISELWQLTLTQLAADGSPVHRGEVVAAFDGGDLTRRLDAKRSALEEKRRERDKLVLEHAEHERTTRLETEEQRARLEKARRKASQPPEIVPRVDYRKLVVELHQAERQMQLSEQRERLAAEQRRQERRLAEAEVARLEAEVDALQKGLAALEVSASRDGVILHLTSWKGEKFAVGSQVWRGQSVAQIPDLDTLAVRAQIPERDLLRVAVGAAARIALDGSGASLPGRVVDIGSAVRSKSIAQPVPVVDALIEFAAKPAGLKPGQTVRVEVALAPAATAERGSAP